MDMTDEEKKLVRAALDSYSTAALSVAYYPDRGSNLYYPALGLGGETGEVLEKIKKLLRDKQGVVTDEFREALKKELGDVLWYMSALCEEAGIRLGDVAVGNIEKLLDRRDRGVLGGSGDNR